METFPLQVFSFLNPFLLLKTPAAVHRRTPLMFACYAGAALEHQAAEAGAETEAEAEAMHILGKGKGTLVKTCVRNCAKNGKCCGSCVTNVADWVAKMFKNHKKCIQNGKE